MLLLAVVLLFRASTGFAAAVEILTPRPGATILSKSPVAHLVVRQTGERGPKHLWVGVDSQMLEPVVRGQHEGSTYLHYLLPLKQGQNVFSLIPEGTKFELHYRPLHGRVPRNLKGIDFFHRDDKLPQSCTPCHSLQKAPSLERFGLGGQESCVTCHGKVLSKAAWQHTTQGKKQCLSCHEQSETPWRIGLPTGKIEDTCLGCHTGKKGWFSRKSIHGPLVLGGCTLCHNPHGEANRYQLWADGAVALCVACHSDKATLLGKERSVPYVHGIIMGPGCVACHDPHATDQRFMLHKPTNQLCVGCHPAYAGVKRGHPVAMHPVSAPKERRRPGRDLNCASCHEPHGSSHKYLLIGPSLGGQFCRECHKK
jgi:predicted CXXCH cytochrome family protein